MRPPRPARGFSLLELLIGLVVMIVVAAGALALMNAQQRSFQATSSDRTLQETARAALSELGLNLRRAGYGIDPWLAFDLGTLTAATPNNVPYACASDVTCRDQTDASDEIVFHARDPAFSRFLAAAPTSAQIKLDRALATPLAPGQILQLLCSGAADEAYVTVAGTESDLVTIDLDTSNATGSFPYQQAKLASGCLVKHVGVAVFKVERFHYYVQTFDEDGQPGGRPYLMLDHGLKDDTGNLVVEPVAPDVEDVQFAYVFNSGAVAGVDEGTQLSKAATSIDLDVAPPGYDTASTDASRNTRSPANIRAVRVGLVVRSPSRDARRTEAEYATVPAAGNRAALTDAPAGYTRLLVETTEATRNLAARGPFMPPFSAASGDGLNVGGG